MAKLDDLPIVLVKCSCFSLHHTHGFHDMAFSSRVETKELALDHTALHATGGCWEGDRGGGQCGLVPLDLARRGAGNDAEKGFIHVIILRQTAFIAPCERARPKQS